MAALKSRLIRKILRRIKKKSWVRTSRRPSSPPPETQVIRLITKQQKRRKKKFLYDYVGPKVDNSPPLYHPRELTLKVEDWFARYKRLLRDNLDLLTIIKSFHFTRGRVDSRWEVPPKPMLWSYYNRVNVLKHVHRENQIIYRRLITQGPKVASTEWLRREWARNRQDIIMKAECAFVLFPPAPREDMEDPAFRRPSGVRRPRVYLTVHLAGHADVGELCCELFTDVCPLTCQLFTDLLIGDRAGYSYVGTHFFRKVPNFFWSGGDVTRDNGFGCYKQCGRRIPIGAENFHFSHSMPGLLSMTVTCDNEMCGIFNITFKPLPQFDLKNVVFGRVIRPSHVFNAMTEIGSAAVTSSYPRVYIRAARRLERGQWVRGAPNSRLVAAHRRQPRTQTYTYHCLK